MAVSIQDPRATPRSIAEQLRRFIQMAEAPHSANGASVSDAGFVLLTLKDQILAEGPRVQHYCQEFISRPLNGIDLLSKVVVVLQGIVSSHGSNSKLSNLLSRNANTTNRKRKAAVAEADCVECMKILLEKTDVAWRSFLESAAGLDAVLSSVNSPQLDSKCYALEILLLLLDQSQGFIIFFRAVTAMAARSRDFLRLSMFVQQLKHGLHTNKLHIQILVVRLFNKLLASAPTQIHRNLAKSEAALAHFSADAVEKMIAGHNGKLGGMDTLIEELSIWKSLNSSSSTSAGDVNHVYGLASEMEGESRRPRGSVSKYPTATTTVAKNVERQRFKKQGMGSGGRSAVPMYYPMDHGRQQVDAFYPDGGRSLTLSNRAYNGQHTGIDENHVGTYSTERRQEGGMRRAKSESAMLVAEREETADTMRRGLKRFDHEQPLYHPIQHTRALSRSVHDLSYADNSPSTASLMRPSSAAARHTTMSPRPLSPIDQRESPPRNRYVSPTSPRARFAEPAVVEAHQPHAGFSYLFPSQPVLASVVPKRAATPEPYPKQATFQRPPSTTMYARTQSPHPPPISPPPDTTPVHTENGQVVYIPINMTDGRRLRKGSQAERRDDYGTESRSSSRMRIHSPVQNGTMGDDVRDALSQFDYLNEYDNASLRRDPDISSYHF